MAMVTVKNNLINNNILQKKQRADLDIESPYATWGEFFLILFIVIFGMFFNEILNIEFADELFELVLLLLFFKGLFLGRLKRKCGWDVKIFFGLSIFYPLYSLTLHLNTTNAILMDLLLQMKPYIAFFSVYYLGISLSPLQKSILRKSILCLVFFSFITMLWALGSINGVEYALYQIYGHSSKFYSGLILLGLLFLYCSDYSLNNMLVFFVIISMGLITLKAKMFGFFFASIALYIFLRKGLEIRFTFKNILLGVILLGGILWAAREKVSFYFLGTSDSLHALARPLLYITSIDVLKDYFPLGSGLASFGTYASSVSYSSLYYRYELDQIWGLSPEMPEFIADTFYPSLAQFGVIGVGLFILFWIFIIRNMNKQKKELNDIRIYLIGCLLIFFLGIELVADAAFTNNRGFLVMVVLGLLLNEGLEKQNKIV